MNKTEIIIRKASLADCEKLCVLMRELAVFEKYIDVFAITPEIVKDCGFVKNPPDFYSIVAEDGDKLAGMLVYISYRTQLRTGLLSI